MPEAWLSDRKRPHEPVLSDGEELAERPIPRNRPPGQAHTSHLVVASGPFGDQQARRRQQRCVRRWEERPAAKTNFAGAGQLNCRARAVRRNSALPATSEPFMPIGDMARQRGARWDEPCHDTARGRSGTGVKPIARHLDRGDEPPPSGWPSATVPSGGALSWLSEDANGYLGGLVEQRLQLVVHLEQRE
jgi:hypothetical protein